VDLVSGTIFGMTRAAQKSYPARLQCAVTQRWCRARWTSRATAVASIKLRLQIKFVKTMVLKETCQLADNGAASWRSVECHPAILSTTYIQYSIHPSTCTVWQVPACADSSAAACNPISAALAVYESTPGSTAEQ